MGTKKVSLGRARSRDYPSVETREQLVGSSFDVAEAGALTKVSAFNKEPTRLVVSAALATAPGAPCSSTCSPPTARNSRLALVISR